ncbi:MAG: hypothetical protein IJK97_01055, partial [Thermoguttaceae bacterium]|nr:hypothetical protein [Thermoguttaceae bacterium]
VNAMVEAKGIVSNANDQAAGILAEVQRRAQTIIDEAKSQASLQMSQLVMEQRKLEKERKDFHQEIETRRGLENLQWKDSLIQEDVKNAKLQAAEILKIAHEQAEKIIRGACSRDDLASSRPASSLSERELQLELLARQLREKQEALQQREKTLAGVRAEMEALAYELVDKK